MVHAAYKDLELKFNKERLLLSYRESAIEGKSTKFTRLLTYAKIETNGNVMLQLNERTYPYFTQYFLQF